ncbi:immunoglobulin alpha Fc receptor isoform X3 [Loxodonta africana]|uniref:immunoglobulin alpha Fc receptor isoform X3 n=1 Tax=Loxodonta africana TaxID=9785 RepID=UPI000C810C50|nr:immunoglobulin alpha Fc receptor isoform X3 [Loxodonta africana]
MIPKGTKLLCLVLCLGQRIQAQDRNFSIPTISAVPGSVVPWNETVKILCKGAPESYLYHLKILRNSKYQQVNEILGYQKEAAVFTIHPMDANSAGNYRCQYRSYKGWSEHSDALDLVVTDTMNQDYTMENLIRMIVAGLVLVALLAILAEDWHSRRVLHKEGRQDLAETSCSKQKCQTEWTLQPAPNGHLADTWKC